MRVNDSFTLFLQVVRAMTVLVGLALIVPALIGVAFACSAHMIALHEANRDCDGYW